MANRSMQHKVDRSIAQAMEAGFQADRSRDFAPLYTKQELLAIASASNVKPILITKKPSKRKALKLVPFQNGRRENGRDTTLITSCIRNETGTIVGRK